MFKTVCFAAVIISVTTTNPIYQKFFTGNEPVSWESFQSSPAEMVRSSTVDFSIDSRTWLQTAKTVGLFVLKIVLFPWGIYECVQYVAQRLIMIGVYPAQSTILSLANKIYFKVIYWVTGMQMESSLESDRLGLLSDPHRSEFITRHVTLQKNGVSYSGLMIGHKDQIRNGKWVLQASGNNSPVEYYATVLRDFDGEVCRDLVGACARVGFNVLLVNPRGVGLSQGTTTMSNIGDGHEVGLCFLETAVNATEIDIVGHSIGGVAVADTVVKHEFKQGIHYHVISQQSLDSVANVFKENAPKWAFLSRLISWAGCDTNAPIEAAKKLSRLGIQHTIINAGTERGYIHDGVIPAKATLGHRLQAEGITQHKEFIYTDPSHSYPMHETMRAIRKWARPTHVIEQQRAS